MRVIQGDITDMNTDAIVNAANSSLMGGGGVDGAIHRRAGPMLAEYCRPLAPCPTGQARITPGFGLAARWIIHTVGPIWRGGEHDEAALLVQCYTNCLHLCAPHDIHSIAFPAISTGAYRFPKKRAAEIAVETCRSFLSRFGLEVDLHFVCFDRAQYDIYASLLS
ncbi:MAG: O-acetyl-ADP-ribose deacetylase [Zetaproteobacteria bacterium]|nr:MAG: O-acetyl-ADP-ribose deacetylase [Zetaproteobacteria bacterium]